MLTTTFNRKRCFTQLSALDKVNAIQRIRLGETKAAVARSIDVPESTLREWCRNEEKLRSLAFTMYSHDKLPTDNKEKIISKNSSAVDTSVSQIKYEDIKSRSYEADVKTNDKNKSQSPLGLSFQEISSNLNLIAQLNNQSTRMPGLNNAHQNGSLLAMSQKESLSDQANSQLKGSTMNKIDMRRLTDNMKISPVASSAYDKPQYWHANHQPISGSNYRYPFMKDGTSLQQQQQHLLQQQQIQNMLPFTTSVQPIRSSTPRKTSSTQSIDDVNSAGFMEWCKYNHLILDMMSDKSNGINGINHNRTKQLALTKQINSLSPTSSNSNFNYTNSSDEISKFNPRCNSIESPIPQSIKTEMEYTVSSSTLSPIPPLVEIRDKKDSSQSPVPPLVNIGDKKEAISHNGASNKTILNKADDMSGSDSALVGPSEAVKYGEKFLKWFESYSDPTITTQDLMQFQRLLQKIKKIAERENSPTLQSSKMLEVSEIKTFILQRIFIY